MTRGGPAGFGALLARRARAGALRRKVLRAGGVLGWLLVTGNLPLPGPPPLLAQGLPGQLPVLRPGTEGKAVAALQLALTNREFSPGAIDGKFGPALAGALIDYQRSRGLVADGIAGPRVWADLGVSPPAAAFRDYTVTSADTAGLATLPEGWKPRDDLAELPYQTVAERLAERYQTSREYLESLNPHAGWPNPAPGTMIQVPAVLFETIAQVALLYRKLRSVDEAEPEESDSATALPAEARFDSTGELDSAAAAEDSALAYARERAADSLAIVLADSAVAALRRQWEQRAPAGVEVRVSTLGRVVRVYQDGRLAARYPATVGSREFPNPEGSWRIVSQVYAPDYRYDERFLVTGLRSERALRVPPGPNNIVGLMWMGLDRDGYGLHGTDEPETIGEAASHGCVRLSNWDAERLARRVGIGTPVTISR